MRGTDPGFTVVRSLRQKKRGHRQFRCPAFFCSGEPLRRAVRRIDISTGRLNVDQLLVRGAEGLEIAIAAGKARLRRKFSGANLVRDFRDFLFYGGERFLVARCSPQLRWSRDCKKPACPERGRALPGPPARRRSAEDRRRLFWRRAAGRFCNRRSRLHRPRCGSSGRCGP